MEPNKVVQDLKTLQDGGREDLIKEGVLEEASVGLRRPKRLSSRGVSAAVIACASPPQKCKKFKCKSAEGRKITRSPEVFLERSPMVSGCVAWVARKRGAGCSSRRSGGSLARRVAAGGRGAVLAGAEACVGRQGAQRGGARVAEAARGKGAVQQAQLPSESMVGPQAAILKERELGDAPKMAAPTVSFNPLPVSSVEGQRVAQKGSSAQERFSADIIVISDEEQDRGETFGIGEVEVGLQSVSHVDGGAVKGGLWNTSLDKGLCRDFKEGSFGSQSALKLGEHVELVDQDGVIFRGRVCGQASGEVYKSRFRVLPEAWQRNVEDDGTGCDAPRFWGGLSGVTVHQEAGRPSDGQSLAVKVRAPLVHRKEGRVKSGAVYPTARESAMPVLMGHGAGSLLDDTPSTSRGAMGRWENQDDEELDFEDEFEERTLPASMAAVKEVTPTVSEVVRGDRSANRRQGLAGNLPRGEVEMGIGMNIRGASGGLLSKGGVDASIQVDSVADSGAGKSEVVEMAVGGVRKEDELSVSMDDVKNVGVANSGVPVKGAVKIVGGSDGIGRRRDEAVRFIMHLIEKGLSAVTIAGKLAGIAFYGKARTGDEASEVWLGCLGGSNKWEMAPQNGRISGGKIGKSDKANTKAHVLGGGARLKRTAKDLSCSDPADGWFSIEQGKISDEAAGGSKGIMNSSRGSMVQTAMHDVGSKMKSKTQLQPAIMKYLTSGAHVKGNVGMLQQLDIRSKEATEKSEVTEVVQGVIQTREGLENSPVYRGDVQSETENHLIKQTSQMDIAGAAGLATGIEKKHQKDIRGVNNLIEADLTKDGKSRDRAIEEAPDRQELDQRTGKAEVTEKGIEWATEGGDKF
ncbi:hypothetical protein NDU88_003476 [Pleurodeles waltl]|uniref:Uncharacterized protein n=1 Tax=Pleurodeles waltl TaxID=8319 RepID=A0AAV7M594_PLEWA|nr:hypothetical protein NDU88_003476 [Pleurodeles waltl]